MLIGHAPRERVSWNVQILISPKNCTRHAPRERVSWNSDKIMCIHLLFVTLHVSVWVEIREMRSKTIEAIVTLHVSVWVEITPFLDFVGRFSVTLHVSVWVEIESPKKMWWWLQSRSTWACELKYLKIPHYNHQHRSRSTWACELKYFTLFNVYNSPKSRSTWACELKYKVYK